MEGFLDNSFVLYKQHGCHSLMGWSAESSIWTNAQADQTLACEAEDSDQEGPRVEQLSALWVATCSYLPEGTPDLPRIQGASLEAKEGATTIDTHTRVVAARLKSIIRRAQG